MDAQVRSLLRNDIIKLTGEDRVVILTSHNISECEMLCTRIAVMESGELKTLARPDELSKDYKLSFLIESTVVQKLGEEEESVFNRLNEFMSRSFKDCRLVRVADNSDLVEYYVPVDRTRLSTVFQLIEANRDDLLIRDYSICRTSLDDIILNL